jgi:hypothetical protein
LKKQTQFMPGLMDVTSSMKGDYDNNPLCGAQQNKANRTVERSQFEPVASPEDIGKRAKSISTATG